MCFKRSKRLRSHQVPVKRDWLPLAKAFPNWTKTNPQRLRHRWYLQVCARESNSPGHPASCTMSGGSIRVDPGLTQIRLDPNFAVEPHPWLLTLFPTRRPCLGNQVEILASQKPTSEMEIGRPFEANLGSPRQVIQGHLLWTPWRVSLASHVGNLKLMGFWLPPFGKLKAARSAAWF